MSATSSPTPVTRTHHPAQNLVVASWLMIPSIVPWLVLNAYVVEATFRRMVGATLIDAAGYRDSLTDHGAAGWAAQIVVYLVALLPAVTGIVLAWIAHRRGEHTAAVLPMIGNAVVAGLILVLILTGTM